MSQKIPKIFLCETCDYNTSNKKDFNKHLSTDKHKTEENNTILIPKIPKNPKVLKYTSVFAEKDTNIAKTFMLTEKNV